MSKNSKQSRVTIRTSSLEARTVLDSVDGAERALNRALGRHYRKVGAELDLLRDEWVGYLECQDYGIGWMIESIVEILAQTPESARDDIAAVLAQEIWADDCGEDLWASTFEDEMYWLEERYEIPYEARCW
jgi:hypothetical protein